MFSEDHIWSGLVEAVVYLLFIGTARFLYRRLGPKYEQPRLTLGIPIATRMGKAVTRLLLVIGLICLGASYFVRDEQVWGMALLGRTLLLSFFVTMLIGGFRYDQERKTRAGKGRQRTGPETKHATSHMPVLEAEGALVTGSQESVRFRLDSLRRPRS